MLNTDKHLFLCSTPLQARICLEIIKFNQLESYDVIYYTTHDTKRDQYYFEKLADNSHYHYYCYGKKKFKGLNSLTNISFIKKVPSTIKRENYKSIYIASIDSFLFRYLIRKHPESAIIGFDDGTANITPSSSYYNLDQRKRTKFLNEILALPTPKKVIDSISRHYTIYPNFTNFVDDDKLIFLDVFNIPVVQENFNRTTTFLIGQPFEYYLTDEEQDNLRRFLSRYKIDYYIMHPKETKPLVANIKVLNNTKSIAEDLILEASEHSQVHVLSGYSTVLFNLSGSHIKRTYLSVKRDNNELERCLLIDKTGAQTVKVYQQSNFRGII